jgi:DHA1 family inner membrane transport protein
MTARITSGAGVGVAYACASALVADVVPYRRRGAGMGAFTAGMFLALPLGLPLAWWLAQHGVWRVLFAIQAAVAVGGALLAVRFVPRSDRRTTSANPLPVLGQPAVIAALLAVMLHNGSFFTVVQLSSRWLDETRLVPKDGQGAVWALLGLFAAIGSFVFGRLADRMGKRNFVLLTSALLVGCMLGLSRIQDRFGLLVFGALLAVVASARTGPLQALISGLVPQSRLGAVMGLRAFAMQLGVFAFAMAASTSGEGWFEGVLYLAAGCQMASYLAIRFGVQEARA